MSEFNPADTDHKSGAHSVTRPGLFAAWADRVDQRVNGFEAQIAAKTPAGQEVAPAVLMAINAIRTGLDVLGEVTEGVRPAYVPAATVMQAVA